MLQADLRELARGPVETQGQLAGSDPLFEGLDVVLAEPVRVAGRLQGAGEGRFYWRGSLSTRMAGQCRRCLAPVPIPVVATVDALFSGDDCRGLCPRCGKDLNAGPCGCPPAVDQGWQGLAALKDKLRD